MRTTDITDILDRLSDVRILVVGDLMLDIFMYGSVHRISPEAPVPVFQFGHQRRMLGGAGNVAVNLAALGCQTTCIGLVGDDEEADTIAELLEQNGSKRVLFTLPNHRSTVKTRMIASHNHILRADRESNAPDISPILADFREKIAAAASESDVILVSDYAKGFITDETAQAVIKIAQRLNKPVLIDPKGADYSKYSGATLVKPNLKEFQEATGMTFDPASESFRQKAALGAKTLFDRYRFGHLIVTLSEYGMLCFSAADPDSAIQIPTEAREVFDVSGAGDTSFAALGAALGAGAGYEEALALANKASGIVVGKLGTSSATAEELREQLEQKSRPNESDNIVSADQIVEILEPLRRRGKVIGFTNGCFDCLHLGHLNSFARARFECDVLVVGVNSDSSVRSYKGPDRPIQDEKTRAGIVAALRYVDYVVVFDETTALPLVEKIRPDVIAKQGYTLDAWPEARFVVAHGGRAVMLEPTPGVSTSEFIAQIKKIKS